MVKGTQGRADKGSKMAWIKMRTNLATDGRVVAIGRAIKAKPASVIGALFIFWSLADEHSEVGFLPGHDAASIDQAVGIKGFAAALNSVGWLAFVDDGIAIPRFEEHNGESAKKRAVSNKRVSEWRQVKRKCNAESVTPAYQNPLPEEMREEKRRGEEESPPPLESKPPPLSDAEVVIRKWVGDRLSASDRHKLADAERQRGEADLVMIHDEPQPAIVLFERSIVEAIASSRDGGFRSMGPFLRLVGAIEARCVRDGVWPGEGLQRQNGQHRPPIRSSSGAREGLS